MNEFYGIFIIESRREGEYYDGETLSDILEIAGIVVMYHYVENIEEFKLKINEFNDSNCRYLHISCHADETGISLTNSDLTNEELSRILRGKLRHKRLFMSACKAANVELASLVISNGAYSLIGSPVKIDSDKSALLWSSFFHVIQEYDDNIMGKEDIKFILKQCVNLFDVPIDYYSFIRNEWKLKMKKYTVRYKRRIESTTINISI